MLHFMDWGTLMRLPYYMQLMQMNEWDIRLVWILYVMVFVLPGCWIFAKLDIALHILLST